MKASAFSWKCIPFSDGTAIAYSASFTAEEFERIEKGLIPLTMENKWFIYYEAPYIFFHRSWTGRPVYRVTAERVESGFKVTETLWANEFAKGKDNGVLYRDPGYQCLLLDFLISNLLLGKTNPFPIPPGIEEAPGVIQAIGSGTRFPEVKVSRRPWWKVW